MKNNITELVFIIDKSGSMGGLESDTIGGFNSMLKKQSEGEGSVLVTTVLFDNDMTTLHDRIPIAEVKPMSAADYVPGGSTALLDAVGNTIRHIEKIHHYARKEDIPEKTLFIITTDGMENASRKYRYNDVKKLIGGMQESGWQFLFLGANIDAAETAGNMGIASDHAVEYHCDSEGLGKVYGAVSNAVSMMRSSACVSAGWKAEVEEDFKSRK
ncbi:MAG: vWA domain-containing protein [Oscillospiraceae bacterium]